MLITDLIAIPIYTNQHTHEFYYCKQPLTKMNLKVDVITMCNLRSEEDDGLDDVNLSSFLLKILVLKFGKKVS